MQRATTAFWAGKMAKLFESQPPKEKIDSEIKKVLAETVEFQMKDSEWWRGI